MGGEVLTAFHLLATWHNLVAIVAGVVIGIIVGILPGLGPSAGVALLIPFTYKLHPTTSLVLLVALWVAAEYSGSVTGILISVPGTPAAAATVLDGFALNQQGLVGKALGLSLTGAVFGGLFGALMLVLFTQPLARFALSFGPAEYCLLGVLGMTMVASLSGKNLLKGMVTALLGLFLTTIGVDVVSGVPRFTFSRPELMDGIPLLPILLGLFAVSEAFQVIAGGEFAVSIKQKIYTTWLSWRELKQVSLAMVIGAIVGTIVGVLPGTGAGIGSWISYDMAKRASRQKEKFGHGAWEGVAAPEAANCAITGASLLPLLAFAVPGSPTAAIILGAFMIHDLRPGPDLFNAANAPIVYSMYMGLILAIIVMFIFGMLVVPYLARLVILPKDILAVVIIILSLLGAYVGHNYLFDVWLALGFGVFGYLLRRTGFPLPPLVLGVVLGNMIEENLRRALLISDGSWIIFLASPAAIIMLILTVLSLFWAAGGAKLLRGNRIRQEGSNG
ncbi:MAG: tripartite tricarboxylate transporter permease [Firmicutes bacterium]|nr:tripartite tricarboxylate transporter permease [Bacillota bacterium]